MNSRSSSKINTEMIGVILGLAWPTMLEQMMQTAAATLAGNAYGAKDKKRMRDLASMFIPIEICLMILSGSCLFIFAPALIQIFSSSEEVITLGATVLRMVAVSEPFYGFSIVIEGMMQGVGKTKQPFVFNIIGMWLFLICYVRGSWNPLPVQAGKA